jgi:hypothetical protein
LYERCASNCARLQTDVEPAQTRALYRRAQSSRFFSLRDRGHEMNYATRRKQIEREERKALRTQREDVAGKLLQKVPDLASLSITIHEGRPNGCANENQYIRRVVVEHAPALFEVPCSFAGCNDGGYDVTREVLFALASHKARFEGEHTCGGRNGTGDCGRILRYVATATYRKSGEAAR